VGGRRVVSTLESLVRVYYWISSMSRPLGPIWREFLYALMELCVGKSSERHEIWYDMR